MTQSPIRDTFRALLASNLDFEAMLIFADVLEEHGASLRLGGGVSARELAAAYRWAGERGKRPVIYTGIYSWRRCGDRDHGEECLPVGIYDYIRLVELPAYWGDRHRSNRHRAFLRLARALRECEKKPTEEKR